MVSQAEYADSHRVLVPTAQFDGLGCRDAFQSSVIRHRRRQPQGARRSPPQLLIYRLGSGTAVGAREAA